MPKGKVETVEINSEVFLSILAQKGTSINELGKKYVAKCGERTLQRAVKDGRIRPEYLEAIAKHINVHPILLSGKLHKTIEGKDEDIRELWLSGLTIENYPYHLNELEILRRKPIEELLSHILSLFDITYYQFSNMPFEQQYEFQYEMFDGITKLIRKYFEADSFGNKDMPNLYRLLANLENYHDDYYIYEHADITLREIFLKNPPLGYTKKQIKAMKPDDLIAIKMELEDMQYNE